MDKRAGDGQPAYVLLNPGFIEVRRPHFLPSVIFSTFSSALKVMCCTPASTAHTITPALQQRARDAAALLAQCADNGNKWFAIA
jgi:hypothetical protein